MHRNGDDRDLLAAHQLPPRRGLTRHRNPQTGQPLPPYLECAAVAGHIERRSIPIAQPVRAIGIIDHPDDHPVMRRVDVEEPPFE